MKRQGIALIIIITLIAAFLISGCGREKDEAQPDINEASAGTELHDDSEQEVIPPYIPPNIDESALEETVQPEPVDPALLPQITKSPYGETIHAGNDTVFVAGADNFDTVVWYLSSPDGSVKYTMAEAEAAFVGITARDADTEVLTISNCITAINGWILTAEFTNSYGTVATEEAELFVVGSGTADLTLDFAPSSSGDGSGTVTLKAGDGDTIKYFVYNDDGVMLESGQSVGSKILSIAGEDGKESNIYVYACVSGNEANFVTKHFVIDRS